MAYRKREPKRVNGSRAGVASNGEDNFKDLGFGTKVTGQGQRMLSQTGSFNVIRKGMPFSPLINSYHSLIRMTWTKFNLIILLCYIIVNLIFASIYYLIGVDSLHGPHTNTPFGQFMNAFFFSAQTFTTVGYGHISPGTMLASGIAAVESLCGLLAFALATGLLYGKFSRPNAKLLFSQDAVIAPYMDKTGFMFRMANARSNQLIEVEVQLNVSMVRYKDGKPVRSFDSLSLERKSINFFPLTWTIVHPIDENSPLLGLSARDFEDLDIEFLILVKAFDDTFNQTVHARSSYKAHEIEWGAKFVNIIDREADADKTVLNLDRIDEIERVALPVYEPPSTVEEEVIN